MFLSDTRYLTIRKNLRQILKDTRDRIERIPTPQEQLTTRNMISIDSNFFQKYVNGIDYNRAKEFYNTIRDLRQNSTRIPCLEIIYIQNKSEYLILQSETFAKRTKELRRTVTSAC